MAIYLRFTSKKIILDNFAADPVLGKTKWLKEKGILDAVASAFADSVKIYLNIWAESKSVLVSSCRYETPALLESINKRLCKALQQSAVQSSVLSSHNSTLPQVLEGD